MAANDWIEEAKRVASGIRRRVMRLTLERAEGCYLSQALSHHAVDNLAVFGAAVMSVDGHDVAVIESAAGSPHPGKPLVVLAHTNPSSGVPLLDERKPNLHFVRFKSDDERKRYGEFLGRM